MGGVDWKQVRAIFEDVVTLAGEERAEALDRYCDGDGPLQAEVQALLDADSEVRDTPGDPNPEANRVRVTVPGYDVGRILGEGSMGAVYLAEQVGPVRREVALKVIRPGLSSSEVVRRFDIERRALALMNHANIACVYDAGATEEQVPFFAMEYVRGTTITDYCVEKQLSLERRLHLFLQLCDGVSHAHQKGVIHRDLKPTNVLATDVDGSARVKILDFGIARAVRADFASGESGTLHGQIVGTPEYMSPEQARGDVDAIDTRTDVYSLGVVLYEMVTGNHPYRTSPDASLREALSVVSNEVPRPLRDWNRQLRGDLELIVAMAMSKQAGDRYPSVTSLADDVRRFLVRAPVRAHPPSRAYELMKMIRRHRVAFAATGVAFCALCFGVLGIWASKRELRVEVEEVRAQHRFVVGLMNHIEGMGKDATLSELLIDEDFISVYYDGRSEGEAVWLNVLGKTLNKWEMYEEALKFLRKALSIRIRLFGETDGRVLSTQTNIAVSYSGLGMVVQEVALLKRVLLARMRSEGYEHEETKKVRGRLVVALRRLGRFEEAARVEQEGEGNSDARDRAS